MRPQTRGHNSVESSDLRNFLHARNGGICTNQFTANFPGKEFGKSVKISQNCGHVFVASLSCPTLYNADVFPEA